MSMVATRWRVLLLLLPLAVSLSAGCDWIPVRRRLDPGLYPLKGRPSAEAGASASASVSVSAIDPPQPPSAGAALARSEVEAEDLPPLPSLRPISDEEALGLDTPMLDSALVRASILREAALERFDRPEKPEDRDQVLLILGDWPDPEEPDAVTAEPEPVPIPAEEIPDPPMEIETPPLREETSISTEPAPEPEPEPTSERWRDGLSDLQALALVEASQGGPSSEIWMARQRVLTWLAEAEDEEAASLWQTVLLMLAEAEAETGADAKPGGRSADSSATLRIADLRLCRRVLNFGKYEELAPADCRPGHKVILYCELEGVGYEAFDGRCRSRLSTTLELLPESGGPPLWSDTRLAEDLCSRPRRDYFVNYVIALPETLPGGSYRLRVSQHDLVTDDKHTRTLPIAVLP